MSIQDDYFDLSNTLEGANKKAFQRIWLWACDMETQIMVNQGELLKEDYFKWKLKQEG